MSCNLKKKKLCSKTYDKKIREGSLRAKMLNCNNVVSEFELQSHDDVGTNTLGKERM